MFQKRLCVMIVVALAAGAMSATVGGCSDDFDPGREAGVDGTVPDAGGPDLPGLEASVPDLPPADVASDQAPPDQAPADSTWPDMPPPDGLPYDASHSSLLPPWGGQHWMFPGRHIDEGWRLAPFNLWRIRTR
jgi:hypothetical protein